MGRLPGTMNLRKVARWLADNDESWNGGDFVADTTVRGVRGLWAELLALAWNHEDGDPKNWRVLTLLSLHDSQLRGLRRWLGSLTSTEARSRLGEVFSEAPSAGKARALLATFANARSRTRFERAEAEIAANKAQRAATAAARAARKAQRVEAAWRDGISRRDAELRRLLPAIQRAVRRAEAMSEYQGRLWKLSFWLENHVWATGCLPTGVVHVGWPELKEVDCDALFGREATGAGEEAAPNEALEPASGRPDA
jgi:hypothetical protein